jgi:hypothetical protein
MDTDLSPASLHLFRLYAEDAPNWSGTPWVTCANFTFTKNMRGNLSDLVQKGYLTVCDSEGAGRARDQYVRFTEKGKALATHLKINLG